MRKVRIHFTECAFLPLDTLTRRLAFFPVEERCREYERRLLEDGGADLGLATHDELLVLIAQCLHRKRLLDVELVSVCNCGNRGLDYRTIPLDADGDMTVDPHHGFFSQRLRYLR